MRGRKGVKMFGDREDWGVTVEGIADRSDDAFVARHKIFLQILGSPILAR